MNYEEFEDLSREHEAILAFLTREEKRTSPSAGFPVLVKLLEQVHHAKEEKFLFPTLFGSRSLEVGGPKCTTFFTPRVIGGALFAEPVRALKLFLGIDSLVPDTPLRKEAAQANSMLSIPLEDHMLGAAAVKELLHPRRFSYEELFPKFAALLRDHIQREEECLLVLFRSALTPGQKKGYASAAVAFDEEHRTATLLEQLARS